MTSTMQRQNGANPGRSSSQISIYDYPEHLNPFHEEDNHKRIRFWRMTTANSKKDGRDRSGSFSINGLKEMWAFKSFRLKKRSSTLGINKTSESPPTLRRTQLVHPADGGDVPTTSTMRHTVNVGYDPAARSGGTSNFNRGAGYRSSLQNVHSNGTSVPQTPDGSFFRNDRYRSTIQNGYQTTPNPRYHPSARGSVTPTPTRGGLMQHGLSQTSLNSTNPFDDDIDTNFDDDTISRTTIGSFSTIGDGRRTYRKKRKAPPPPPPRTSSEPNHASKAEAVITTVEETSREASTEDEKDLAEISNLAAQIESFVRTADTDKEKIRQTPDRSTTPPKAAASKTQTKTVTTTQTTTTISHPIQPPVVEEIRVQVHQRHRTPERFNVSSSSRSSSSNSRVSPENNDAYPVQRNNPSPVNNEKQINTLERPNPKIIIREATQEDERLENQSVLAAVPKVSTPISSEVERILENGDIQPQRTTVNHEATVAESTQRTVEVVRTVPGSKLQQVQNLKITESNDDVSLTDADTPPTNDPERYKIRFVAIKPVATTPTSPKKTPSFPNQSSYINGNDRSPQKITRNHKLESLPTIDQDHDYDNVVVRTSPPPQAPPKRRRSVKDIIESINKSQSLLRINQDPNGASLNMDARVSSLDQFPLQKSTTASSIPGHPANYPYVSNESIVRNLTELQASEAQMHQIIYDMERSSSDNNNNTTAALHIDDDYEDVLSNIPVTVERFSDFSNEFKKCTPVNQKAAATSSPVLVQRRDKSNRTDWNPLPKPRRSRNLTQEAEAGKF